MKKKLTFIIMLFFFLTGAAASTFDSFEKDSLTIYPNPAINYLKLELKSNLSINPEIKIIDLTGKVVLKFDQKFLSEQALYKAEINIAELKAGIYFVKVIQGETIYAEKLIVK